MYGRSFVSAALTPTMPPKPALRGVLHRWAAPVALLAGAWLLTTTRDTRAALSGGIFVLSMVVMFVVSATYHGVNWAPAARARMRRADHACIFLLIAGTYTPFALLGLPTAEGTTLVKAVWVGAALSIAASLFWVSKPKVVTAAMGVVLGWFIVPYLSELRAALSTLDLVFVFGGGLAYTLGAVVYATKRLNFRPDVFGYHEVFHALTLVGAGCHFIAVMSLMARHAA